MEKVKLTKKQAEALEQLRSEWSKGAIIRTHVESSWTISKYRPLNELSIEELAKALINGYEVEQTPEEKLREYYELSNFLRYDKEDLVPTVRQRMIGEQMGVRKTLNILGIKVEGINVDKTEGDE